MFCFTELKPDLTVSQFLNGGKRGGRRRWVLEGEGGGGHIEIKVPLLLEIFSLCFSYEGELRSQMEIEIFPFYFY